MTVGGREKLVVEMKCKDEVRAQAKAYKQFWGSSVHRTVVTRKSERMGV
jgi:hypothetical protein